MKMKEKPCTIKEPYMITITTDGRQLYLSLNEPPSLELIHSALDDDMEIIPYFSTLGERPCVAFCGEHGKMRATKFNLLAQALWADACPQVARYDKLMGPVVIIVGPKEFLASM